MYSLTPKNVNECAAVAEPQTKKPNMNVPQAVKVCADATLVFPLIVSQVTHPFFLSALDPFPA